jgi:hypothetical protein
MLQHHPRNIGAFLQKSLLPLSFLIKRYFIFMLLLEVIRTLSGRLDNIP